ncbi:Palmitoylated plasma membrane-bound casein kinase [Basidiobolus ranarum]|uniref:Palmitoylated plasma membrane-bound casein kinase n=1 Tax=Basidiobolus ranarum TaxID=34480 RepID=A0ABR2W6R1_9FUNG
MAHKSSNSQGSHSGPAIVGEQYKIGKKIGEGSFGVIYEGVHLAKNQAVAIKFEPRKSDAPQLRDEYRTYKILAGTPGVPSAYYFGQEGMHNFLVIDLLGPSLEDLFEMCRRKFSVKTVAMLAKQMLTRVEAVHNHHLIYRDIKPDNFLSGRLNTKQCNMVYLVDFGMAKQYRDPKTKQHIPYRERKSLSGTARYMSINTHLGREQSRRDDLESLGHVFFYFLRGSLPWQGLKAATNKQKYERIGEKKQTTPVKELCEGFPEQFATYLTYVRKLGFEETPNYDYLRGLFDQVILKVGQKDDGIYDWMLLDGSKQLENVREANLKPMDPLDPARMTTRATTSQRYSGHPRQSPRYSSDAARPSVNRGNNHSTNVSQPENVLAVNSNMQKSAYPFDGNAPASTPNAANPTPNPEEKKGFFGHIMDILACRSCS